MVGGHCPAELVDPVSKVGRFEQQQLDDEEAALRLVALVVPQRHAEHEPVQRDDVVLPDHVVHGVDTLVDVPAATRLTELVHEEVAVKNDTEMTI